MTQLTAWWCRSRSRWLQVWWLDCQRLNHNDRLPGDSWAA